MNPIRPRRRRVNASAARGDESHREDLVPSIGDYAIIGDCRSAALASNAGSIDWLCLPNFSNPSVFASILDPERGGRFSITPRGQFSTTRRYAGSSAILETTFETAKGTARLTDGMILGRSARNFEPMREIVRVVEGLDGTVLLDLTFEPRPDYARTPGRTFARGRDWVCTWGNEIIRLRSERELQPRDGGVGAELEIKAGEKLYFSLSYEKGDIAILQPLGEGALGRLRRTSTWWEEWANDCRCDGPYRDAALRSVVTLKLLTFALSGAVVAAPTTSLPEWIGGSRNWDYRYCWLRDAALTMRAFTGLGLQREAEAFLRWLLHATALTQPRLGVVYDVFGRANLSEREVKNLSGYRASKPVRVGNAAHKQMQLDVYGAVVVAAAEFVASGGSLQHDQKKLLAGFGQMVCDHWREPDHGIWEIRDRKRHYTFSKLMCWVALDRLLEIDPIEGLSIRRNRFEEERSAIAEAIEVRGFNGDLDAYVGELDGDRMDASLLLMPCLGYGNPEDARMRTTFERIEARLGRDGLFYRYEPHFDAVAAPEGAFGICSFWAIENLARRGDLGRAERLFEGMLGHANDVGLFAEEIDPEDGEALGNFPQAFTHIGLINAALAIGKARREHGDGAV